MDCIIDFSGKNWMQNMKWKEVEAYLDKGGDTVLIPCGQTEQHGPHLPMGTDTYAAMAMAEALAERTHSLIPHCYILFLEIVDRKITKSHAHMWQLT